MKAYPTLVGRALRACNPSIEPWQRINAARDLYLEAVQDAVLSGDTTTAYADDVLCLEDDVLAILKAHLARLVQP